MIRSSPDALAYFDSLPAVDIQFMLGKWSGSELETGHPMDGILTALGWKGKDFKDQENVHPLLFQSFAVNPDLIPLSLGLMKILPRTKVLSHLIKVMKPVLSTKKAKARLEMISYRNKTTCAMLYTGQPIIDHFAKIDDMTVLGVMELKDWPPYFFKLTRLKMHQIAMTENGGPEVLKLIHADKPRPGPGEVLIEVYAAGINRPDLAQRAGLYPPPPGASPILGLEVAGKIAAAPSGSKFKAGDKVCALVHGGGYSEYCLAPEPQCLPIPEGLSFEEAAGIPETYFTVWANVFQMGHLKSGERFLVHGGASGIGTTAIQLARAFGAEVYTTAGSDEKCRKCEALGAHVAINYETQNFEEVISEKTQGKGIHLILDMVGGTYTERNLNALAFQGRLVQIATQESAKVTINLMKLMQKQILLTGSTMRPRTIEDKAIIASELYKNVWPLLEEKKVRVLIDRIYPLAEASLAHAYLDSGSHMGKVILSVKP